MQLIDEYCAAHYALRDRAAALALLGRLERGEPGLFIRVGEAALVPAEAGRPLEVLEDLGCGVLLPRAAPEAAAGLRREMRALEARLAELRPRCFPEGYFSREAVEEVVRTNPGTMELARRAPADLRVAREPAPGAAPAGEGPPAGEEPAPRAPVLEAEEGRGAGPRPPRAREARSRFARAWEERRAPGPRGPPAAGPRDAPPAQ